MKTYTKQVEESRLVIQYDDWAENPRREMDTLGYFITYESKRVSPDTNEVLENIIGLSGDIAKDLNEHISLIKRDIKRSMSEEVIAIFPVYRYEHSGLSFHLGTSSGWDISNCGFYIVTDKTAQDYEPEIDDYEPIIKKEIDMYNKYVNGEVYRFTLYDEDGNEEDSCGGFYDIDDIQGSLPKEWSGEDLSTYVVL